MRKISLLQATTAIFVLGASNGYAMCGSNLSPARTPYAVLQPQTAATVLATPLSDTAARLARVKALAPAHY
jgi:hypothetical protein